MVTIFLTLNLPAQILTGWKRDKWVVGTSHEIDGKPYGYLHNDNEINETMLIGARPHGAIFETRLDALAEIRTYYRRYKEKFPYDDELSKELNAELKRIRQLQDIESQTMVFK